MEHSNSMFEFMHPAPFFLGQGLLFLISQTSWSPSWLCSKGCWVRKAAGKGTLCSPPVTSVGNVTHRRCYRGGGPERTKDTHPFWAALVFSRHSPCLYLEYCSHLGNQISPRLFAYLCNSVWARPRYRSEAVGAGAIAPSAPSYRILGKF